MSVAETVMSPSQFVVRPNRSLSWHGNKLFIVSLAVISLGISGFFAFVGLWVILPFAGLEITALWTGLYICSKRIQHCEVISIDDETVRIEVGRNSPTSTQLFQRAWTTVELCRPSVRGHPSRLIIRSKGKGIEIGACLTESEKKELAQSLRNAVGGLV